MSSGISYSAGMELIDSMVITYRIYCLKHPTTNEIFYIGKTTKELKERLTGHLGSINTNGSNQEKNDYIIAILDIGQRPIIEEIEAIYGTCYIHKVEASAREYYWISHYQKLGIELKNHFGVKTDTYSLEWQSYLTGIKEGDGRMRHYLCGQNKYGVPVYDEEKMNDDGFALEKLTTSQYIEQMKDIDKPKWIYEKIYDDESPDYIRGSIEE